MRQQHEPELAYAGILTEMAALDGEFDLAPEASDAERRRFAQVQSRLRGQFRHRQAAASLERIQVLVNKIREGYSPEGLQQAIEGLRISIGVDQPELAVCFRSLTERSAEDLDGMLEDVLLLQDLAAQVEPDAE